MLFHYRYVPHPLERLHTWMEHTVVQVWCRNGGPFQTSLLCKDLQDIATAMHNNGDGEKSIIDEIRDLDTLIQGLTNAKRQELALMFRQSTAVDALCANQAGSTPSSIRELLQWDLKIARALTRFFTQLFERHIKSGPIKKLLGDLKSHFEAFTDRTQNGEDVCPFCGLVDLKNADYRTREAYDHFLPKHRYPFNSVNFRNLAPMCHTCNSSYKTTKDPIRRRKGAPRQKAFTPFDSNIHFPDIRAEIDPTKIDELRPADVKLTVSSPSHQEEFETWLWLFGIEERYKGKLCQKRGAKHWLTNITEAKDPRGYLDAVRTIARRDPLDDDSFLKKAALDAFERNGLLTKALAKSSS
jgi:hypothetical protein